MFRWLFCVMLTTFVFNFVISSSRASDADRSSRALVSSPSLFIETAVDMIVYLEAATGTREKAICFRDQYYGRSDAVRSIVNLIWRYPDYPYEAALVVALKSLCATGKDAPSIDNESWKYAYISGIAPEKTSDTSVRIAASISLLQKKAIIDKNEIAAQCIESHQASNEITQAVKNKILSDSSQSAIKSAYDVVKAFCRYPTQGVETSVDIIKAVVDPETAARERLLAVRDLKSCDKYVDETAKKSCPDFLARVRKM